METIKKSISITGLILHNTSDNIIVEVEVDGQWIEVINYWVGSMDFAIAHIVGARGIKHKIDNTQEVEQIRK